jgi:hypothetical protein
MNKQKKAAGSHQTAFHHTCINYNLNNKTIKPFPPYGKKLFNALQCGYKPINDVFLFIGKNAWQKAKYFSNWQDVLVLPPHSHPDKFDWSITKKLSVLVFDTGNVQYEVIRKLAYNLLSALASIVRVVLATSELVVFLQGDTDNES